MKNDIELKVDDVMARRIAFWEKQPAWIQRIRAEIRRFLNVRFGSQID